MRASQALDSSVGTKTTEGLIQLAYQGLVGDEVLAAEQWTSPASDDTY
jgi:hypothetical protein